MHEFKPTGVLEPILLAPRSWNRLVARLASLARSGEWWEHKLVPGLAVLYATAFRSDVGVFELAVMAAVFVSALAAGAAFVSALNDLTDREDDRHAGKPDRIGTSTAMSWLLVVTSGAVGLIFLWNFAFLPLLFWTYAAGWIAFAAYSLRPLRLKARAAPGIACDAIGSHAVPAVLALLLAQEGIASLYDPWVWAVAAWSLACGLRGIISHQLADEMFDRAAGLETFVIRFGPHGSRLLARHFLFPVELAALSAMLLMTGSSLPVFALAASALFLVGKAARFGVSPVLTGPAPRQVTVLSDFYTVFLPIALLLALASRDPAFALLIPAHVLLFPRNISATIRDVARLTREELQ